MTLVLVVVVIVVVVVVVVVVAAAAVVVMRSFHRSSRGREISEFAKCFFFRCYRGTRLSAQLIRVMLCWAGTCGKLLCGTSLPVKTNDGDE